MLGNSHEALFTLPDAWNGGFYETTFFYPAGSVTDPVLSALWSFAALAGPVASRSTEPWEQPQLDPTSRVTELDGVVALPGGARAACATFLFRRSEYGADYDEVTFAVPMGSLVHAWPEVGGFPFGVTKTEVEVWEPRFESLLVALARHLFAEAPFLRGLTGFEGMWDEGLTAPGPIPASHGEGIFDVGGGGLTWHAPTIRGGFETEGGDPLTL